MRRVAIGIALVGALGCNGTHPGEGERTLPAGTIVIQPAALGELERPAVELSHDGHVKAVAKEGCTACHPRDGQGRLSIRFGRVDETGDRNALLELYHARCTSCHKERKARGEKSGPVTCGECHARRAPSRPARQAMRWDYELHDRHVRFEERHRGGGGGDPRRGATNETEKCERCHHVKDPATGKPVAKKGAEEGCVACHGARTENGVRSLREAAHQSCVPCHLDRQQKHEEAGPVTCGGCHGDGVRKAAAGTLKRLQRGQKDQLTIQAAAGRAAKVPGVRFDHKAHEGTAPFCSTCHHQGLASCASCHTVTGSRSAAAGNRGRGPAAPRDQEDARGVTFEAAYHRPSSERSCVGCHAKRTEQKACAGCHGFPLGGTPSSSSCTVCHAKEAPASAPASPALPAVSEGFPESVTISTLQKRYGPSLLPHRKIVARLATLAEGSALARRFHGQAETLCRGCHHRSPAGTRPPTCQSCHPREPGRSGEPTADKPGLTAAYHRQCIGCHEAMGIGKTGCTDCHKPATAGSTEEGR